MTDKKNMSDVILEGDGKVLAIRADVPIIEGLNESSYKENTKEVPTSSSRDNISIPNKEISISDNNWNTNLSVMKIGESSETDVQDVTTMETNTMKGPVGEALMEKVESTVDVRTKTPDVPPGIPDDISPTVPILSTTPREVESVGSMIVNRRTVSENSPTIPIRIPGGSPAAHSVLHPIGVPKVPKSRSKDSFLKDSFKGAASKTDQNGQGRHGSIIHSPGTHNFENSMVSSIAADSCSGRGMDISEFDENDATWREQYDLEYNADSMRENVGLPTNVGRTNTDSIETPGQLGPVTGPVGSPILATESSIPFVNATAIARRTDVNPNAIARRVEANATMGGNANMGVVPDSAEVHSSVDSLEVQISEFGVSGQPERREVVLRTNIMNQLSPLDDAESRCEKNHCCLIRCFLETFYMMCSCVFGPWCGGRGGPCGKACWILFSRLCCPCIYFYNRFMFRCVNNCMSSTLSKFMLPCSLRMVMIWDRVKNVMVSDVLPTVCIKNCTPFFQDWWSRYPLWLAICMDISIAVMLTGLILFISFMTGWMSLFPDPELDCLCNRESVAAIKSSNDSSGVLVTGVVTTFSPKFSPNSNNSYDETSVFVCRTPKGIECTEGDSNPEHEKLRGIVIPITLGSFFLGLIMHSELFRWNKTTFAGLMQVAKEYSEGNRIEAFYRLARYLPNSNGDRGAGFQPTPEMSRAQRLARRDYFANGNVPARLGDNSVIGVPVQDLQNQRGLTLIEGWSGLELVDHAQVHTHRNEAAVTSTGFVSANANSAGANARDTTAENPHANMTDGNTDPNADPASPPSATAVLIGRSSNGVTNGAVTLPSSLQQTRYSTGTAPALTSPDSSPGAQSNAVPFDEEALLPAGTVGDPSASNGVVGGPSSSSDINRDTADRAITHLEGGAQPKGSSGTGSNPTGAESSSFSRRRNSKRLSIHTDINGDGTTVEPTITEESPPVEVLGTLPNAATPNANASGSVNAAIPIASPSAVIPQTTRTPSAASSPTSPGAGVRSTPYHNVGSYTNGRGVVLAVAEEFDPHSPSASHGTPLGNVCVRRGRYINPPTVGGHIGPSWKPGLAPPMAQNSLNTGASTTIGIVDRPLYRGNNRNNNRGGNSDRDSDPTGINRIGALLGSGTPLTGNVSAAVEGTIPSDSAIQGHATGDSVGNGNTTSNGANRNTGNSASSTTPTGADNTSYTNEATRLETVQRAGTQLSRVFGLQSPNSRSGVVRRNNSNSTGGYNNNGNADAENAFAEGIVNAENDDHDPEVDGPIEVVAHRTCRGRSLSSTGPTTRSGITMSQILDRVTNLRDSVANGTPPNNRSSSNDTGAIRSNHANPISTPTLPSPTSSNNRLSPANIPTNIMRLSPTNGTPVRRGVLWNPNN